MLHNNNIKHCTIGGIWSHATLVVGIIQSRSLDTTLSNTNKNKTTKEKSIATQFRMKSKKRDG